MISRGTTLVGRANASAHLIVSVNAGTCGADYCASYEEAVHLSALE